MQQEKLNGSIRRHESPFPFWRGPIFVLCLFLPSLAESQTPSPPSSPSPSVQSVVERMDRTLSCPDGFGRGELSVQNEEGRFAFHPFHLYCRDGNRLFLFFRSTGAVEEKLLFLAGANAIWQQDVLRNRLRRLDGSLRYGSIFHSGITFEDMSGFSLEGSYDPVPPPPPPPGGAALPENLSDESAAPDTQKTIWLRPLAADERVRIAIQYDASGNGAPIRIDSYDKNHLLVRSRRFFYDPLPAFKSRKSGEHFPGPSGIEVMDMEHNTISRMLLLYFDTRVSPERNLFDPGNLRP